VRVMQHRLRQGLVTLIPDKSWKPLADAVVAIRFAVVDPAALWAITRSRYLVPGLSPLMKYSRCGCTLLLAETHQITPVI